MIMTDDKKKRATLIASKLSAGMTEAPTNEMGDEVDDDMGLTSAAEEIMQAVESKDAGQLVSALKSFIEMCSSAETAE